jgi:hypothetical protein
MVRYGTRKSSVREKVDARTVFIYFMKIKFFEKINYK